MAIIDVVKYQSDNDEFVWKYPSEDLRLGSQLVVSISQVAFFVKGGKILDQYESGTHTIKSENIPLLNKIINLPFGNNSPFQAEVWFVNLTSKMDVKWGTPTPINLEDPKYSVIVPVRAYGQYGFRISEPKLFLETLVGNVSVFTADKISDYFKGKLLSVLASLISSKLIRDNISILEINAFLDEMSEFSLSKLNKDFGKFGIELSNFNFISISIPENDPSLMKLKEAKDLAAKIKIVGRDLYQLDRSFNVLDKAAENEGGIAGGIINAGIGLGVGLGVGGNINSVSSNLNTSSFNQPPPIPNPTVEFYILINNQQNGPYEISRLSELVIAGLIDRDTLVWRKGMDNWEPAIRQIEFIKIFDSIPPKPPKS